LALVTDGTVDPGTDDDEQGVEPTVDDWTETVVVEGRALTIRQIRDDDVDRLRRLFFRLSPETVYRRFFQPVKQPSEKLLHHLAEVDHERRQALVAECDDEIVAVVRYDLEPGHSAAEVAVVVEDAWQGHGLGRRLLRRLALDAIEHGVVELTATVLGENHRALALAHRLAPGTHSQLDHGEWYLDMHLPAPQ
jgi:GNAT superfamily N-acetyltransferase